MHVCTTKLMNPIDNVVATARELSHYPKGNNGGLDENTIDKHIELVDFDCLYNNKVP